MQDDVIPHVPLRKRRAFCLKTSEIRLPDLRQLMLDAVTDLIRKIRVHDRFL